MITRSWGLCCECAWVWCVREGETVLCNRSRKKCFRDSGKPISASHSWTAHYWPQVLFSKSIRQQQTCLFLPFYFISKKKNIQKTKICKMYRISRGWAAEKCGIMSLKKTEIITKRIILRKWFDPTKLKLQAEDTFAKPISVKLFDSGSQSIRDTEPVWKPYYVSF